jgi:hypothetical protein
LEGIPLSHEFTSECGANVGALRLSSVTPGLNRFSTVVLSRQQPATPMIG